MLPDALLPLLEALHVLLPLLDHLVGAVLGQTSPLLLLDVVGGAQRVQHLHHLGKGWDTGQ